MHNGFTAILSNYLFRPNIDYRIILYESHIAFGVGEDSDKLLANSYESLKTFFRSHKQWAALVHSGWIIYLTPSDDGDFVKKYIEDKLKRERKRNFEILHQEG